MITNFTIKRVIGTLTLEDVSSICFQLGGKASSVSYFWDMENTIASGDFRVEISRKQLLSLSGCKVHFVTESTKLSHSVDEKFNFLCIVVQQPNKKIHCVNSKDLEFKKHIDLAPPYDKSVPVLLMFEVPCGRDIDYLFLIEPHDDVTSLSFEETDKIPTPVVLSSEEEFGFSYS